MALLQQKHVAPPEQMSCQVDTIIRRWEEIPRFNDDREEAEFWRHTQLSLELMAQSVASAAEVYESVTITIRMDPRMLLRIKRLARSRFLNYQSMLKQWIAERLEEELRKQQTGRYND